MTSPHSESSSGSTHKAQKNKNTHTTPPVLSAFTCAREALPHSMLRALPTTVTEPKGFYSIGILSCCCFCCFATYILQQTPCGRMDNILVYILYIFSGYCGVGRTVGRISGNSIHIVRQRSLVTRASCSTGNAFTFTPLSAQSRSTTPYHPRTPYVGPPYSSRTMRYKRSIITHTHTQKGQGVW